VAHDLIADAAPPTRAGSLTLHLNRRATYFFAALLLLTIPAFWPSYLFPPKPVNEMRVHVHGFAMLAWLLLLVSQAALIRTGNRTVHRHVGKVSYVLVPFIVLSTISVLHLRLNQKIDAELLYFLYVILSLTVVFAVAYALAMVNRAKPPLHARYMVCTALALVDPIVGRIVFFYGGIEPPAMQVVTYALVDGILLWLAYKDWKSSSGIRVFPAMLAVFVAAQIPTFFIFRAEWWPEFARWLAALPIG
jgi:hypothetical protein